MSLVNGSFLQLWPAEAPGAQGSALEDIPALQVCLPADGKATGAAMIVCPGGGYVILADHEGLPVGQWLATHGVTAFILRYRLGPKYRHPIPLCDAQRAIRFVRAHAADWGIDTKRIGILGFSAGGHLTSMTATHFVDGDINAVDPVERVSSRPDAHILVYPVITKGLGEGIWRNIVGDHLSEDLIDFFSTDMHVTEHTPPAFLVHSTHDIGVKVTHSDRYAASLAAAGIPYEYTRDNIGDHGFGLVDRWTQPCAAWLEKIGFANGGSACAN